MNNLDVFGGSINIYHNSKNYLTSTFGGFVSILMLTLLGFLFYGFGQDFFHRKNPVFIKSTYSPDSYTFQNFTNKNFSIAFRLEDSGGKPIELNNQWYYEVKASQYLKNKKTREFELKELYSLPIVNCNASLIYDNGHFWKTFNLIRLNSPVINNSLIGGFWDDEKVAYIDISLYSCEEGNTNPFTNEKCGSNEEKTQYYINNNIFFNMYYQETIVNPENYLSGLKKKISSKYYLVDNKVFKYTNTFVKEVLMTSDFGWLISQISLEKSYSVSKIDYDTNLIDPYLRNNKLLIQTFIYYERESDHYKREFPKIQTVAAQVGGILKVAMMIAGIIVKSFNLNLFVVSISNFLNNRYQEKDCTPSFIENGNKKLISSNKISKLEVTNIVGNNSLGIGNSKSISDIDNLNKDEKIFSLEAIGFEKFTTRLSTNLYKLEKSIQLKENSWSEDINFCESLYYNLADFCSTIKITCCFNKEKVKKITDSRKEYFKLMNFLNIFPKFAKYDYFLKMLLNDDQLMALKCQALSSYIITT